MRFHRLDSGISFFFKQWGEWRPPEETEDFSTAKGQAQRVPAFIVSRADGTVHCYHNEFIEAGAPMLRVGKKHAGRSLESRVWDEFPRSSVLHPKTD